MPDGFPAPPRAAETAVAVSRVVSADSPEGISGFSITYPRAGSSESVYSLPLEGWVVPTHAAPREILVHGAHRPLPRAPVAIERPDVAPLHPEQSWAGRSGFALRLNALQLARRFRLQISVDLEDGSRARLGTIEGERRAFPAHETRYRPLIVTTLGRSGSTWLTWLLGRHPEIADYRSFEYESKVAPYFAEALRALTQPSSYYQPIRAEIDHRGWWLGEDPSWPLAWHRSDDSIDEWLGSEHVEELIEFFAGRTDALFGRLAQAIGKEAATYVVEKLPPNYFVQGLLAETLPGTREIFLVRDFRDVAASIFAFGEKRGRKWYGASPSASDEQIVAESLRHDIDQMIGSWAERRDSAFLVRYEDLVLRPEETLAGVFSYLDLDARPETVAAVLAEGTAAVNGDMRDSHITSGTAERSIGRWQRDLPPGLRRTCEESLREGLEAFGYA